MRGEHQMLHATTKYKSMRALVGAKVRIDRGVTYMDGQEPDGDITILEDYGRTILLDMEWIRSVWGIDMAPRHVRTLITKASLACGDVVLRLTDGTRILPEQVAEFTYNVEILRGGKA